MKLDHCHFFVKTEIQLNHLDSLMSFTTNYRFYRHSVFAIRPLSLFAKTEMNWILLHLDPSLILVSLENIVSSIDRKSRSLTFSQYRSTGNRIEILKIRDFCRFFRHSFSFQGQKHAFWKFLSPRLPPPLFYEQFSFHEEVALYRSIVIFN